VLRVFEGGGGDKQAGSYGWGVTLSTVWTSLLTTKVVVLNMKIGGNQAESYGKLLSRAWSSTQQQWRQTSNQPSCTSSM
jgi:hypothetical protein